MNAKHFYKWQITGIILLISLISFNVSAQIKCADIFSSRYEADSFLASTQPKMKSPSKMNPVFRILHTAFDEYTTDGLAYLNLSNTSWSTKNNKSTLKVRISAADIVTTEGVVSFHVNANQRETIIEAVERLEQFNYGFHERQRPFGDATYVKIRASSTNPNIVHKLILGEKSPYEISFKAPTEPADIIIAIPKNDNIYDIGTYNNKVRLIWEKTSGSFTLNIFGPISFERDVSVEGSYAREHALNHHYFNLERNYSQTTKYNYRQILEKAIQHLFDESNINETLNIASGGEAAILAELKKIGINSFVELNKKVDTQGFFSIIMASGDQQRIPIETGEFAKEHGAYAHALQLITMTRNMTDAEIKLLIQGPYVGVFTRDPSSWRAWDSLFDAPGDSLPSSPLWWRKVLELRHIM